jgi:RimJ/RimL family protein N-acetyltransferase
MRVTTLTTQDAEAILNWPAYPSEFAELDYALRKHGWLHQFPESRINHRFGAWEDDILIGFAVLNRTAEREAEFYIALRPNRVGLGFGETLAQRVLAKGFDDLSLERIYLRVRTWHTRAIRLYEKIGFKKIKEIESEIDGQKVRVLVMLKQNPA